MIRINNSGALCASIFTAFLLTTTVCQADPQAGSRSTSPTTTVASAPIDIALSEDGMLHGTALNASGVATPNVTVRLIQNQHDLARAITDGNGRFTIAGVRGGTYVLATRDDANVYRVWAPGTAPPAAKTNAMLISEKVVRGQNCAPGAPCGVPGCGGCGGRHGLRGGGPGGIFGGINLPSIHPGQWLHNPVIIGAAIGGAIAIPVALHDNEFAS